MLFLIILNFPYTFLQFIYFNPPYIVRGNILSYRYMSHWCTVNMSILHITEMGVVSTLSIVLLIQFCYGNPLKEGIKNIFFGIFQTRALWGHYAAM